MTSRIPWLLVPLALLSALWSAGAAGQGPKTGKTRSSANGLYAVRIVEDEPGKCRVEALKGQELAWTLPKCLGTADDLIFINNAGDRLWVLHTLPEIPPKKKGSRKPPQLSATVVELFDNTGKRLKSKKLGDYLPQYRMVLVRSLDKHFKWLEGVYDVPGKGPRLTDGDFIEFETVASKTHKLEFK